MNDLYRIVQDFECSLDEDMTAEELQDALTEFFLEWYKAFDNAERTIVRSMEDIIT